MASKKVSKDLDQRTVWKYDPKKKSTEEETAKWRITNFGGRYAGQVRKTKSGKKVSTGGGF